MSPSTLDAKGGDRWSPPDLDATRWLSLAAAPTFVIMALATSLFAGPSDMLCLGGGHASPLSGMVPMYALMSVFHSAPWLRRIASLRPRHRNPRSIRLERPFISK
jgi:hypothetical protein